jgi:hypothetical protein
VLLLLLLLLALQEGDLKYMVDVSADHMRLECQPTINCCCCCCCLLLPLLQEGDLKYMVVSALYTAGWGANL